MSILPPSIMTAKWMLTRPDLTTVKTSKVRNPDPCALDRSRRLSGKVHRPAVRHAETACRVPSISEHAALEVPLRHGDWPCGNPLAVAAVLRGPRRREGTPAVSVEQK